MILKSTFSLHSSPIKSRLKDCKEESTFIILMCKLLSYLILTYWQSIQSQCKNIFRNNEMYFIVFGGQHYLLFVSRFRNIKLTRIHYYWPNKGWNVLLSTRTTTINSYCCKSCHAVDWLKVRLQNKMFSVLTASPCAICHFIN